MHEPTDTSGNTVSLAPATSGRLVVTGQTAGVMFHADPALTTHLYHARFARHAPVVEVHGGTVIVHYRHVPFVGGRLWAREPLVEITLNGSIPWEVEFRGACLN